MFTVHSVRVHRLTVPVSTEHRHFPRRATTRLAGAGANPRRSRASESRRNGPEALGRGSLAALALACGLTAFGGSPALAPGPAGGKRGDGPGSLSVSWQARDGAIDYDLRYHAGSADPADEADWIEGRRGERPAGPRHVYLGDDHGACGERRLPGAGVRGDPPTARGRGPRQPAPRRPRRRRRRSTTSISSRSPSHDGERPAAGTTPTSGARRSSWTWTFNEPVEVGGDGNVVLRLDLGGGRRRPGQQQEDGRSAKAVRYGDTVLRFAYTVADGDTDVDGVWVQTGVNDTVLFTPGSANRHRRGQRRRRGEDEERPEDRGRPDGQGGRRQDERSGAEAHRRGGERRHVDGDLRRDPGYVG